MFLSREQKLQNVLSAFDAAVGRVHGNDTDKALLHASENARVAVRRLKTQRETPVRGEDTLDVILKSHSHKVISVKKSTIGCEENNTDPGDVVRTIAKERLENYDNPIQPGSDEHKRVSNIRKNTAVKLLSTEFGSIKKYSTHNGNPISNIFGKVVRKMSAGSATLMEVNGSTPAATGGVRRTFTGRSDNGRGSQQRPRFDSNVGNGNVGNGNVGNGNGGNGNGGNGNGGNGNEVSDEDEDNEDEPDSEPEDLRDIEDAWLESATTIENAKKEKNNQKKMKADLVRIELNSTSGMLAGVGYFDRADTSLPTTLKKESFVPCPCIMGGDSLTWTLPSNLTAELTSSAFYDILNAEERIAIQQDTSENQKILSISDAIDRMNGEDKESNFLKLLWKKENDVWSLGTRQAPDVTDGDRKKYTCSENVHLTKTVVGMNDLERGALIDLCGFGAFRNYSLKDAVLGTFVVRGFEKISRENESNRAKIIVEDDTFHFWMSEGAHGGISFLKHFKDAEWDIMKIHPDAFEKIEFLGQDEKLVSAREMIVSGFRSAKRYMQSWQGLYYCYRKNAKGEVEVRWLFNIISICRLGHLELWLLWDYRRLLAMINVVRFLRGKRVYAFNSNPLKDALDERMNGRIFRKFLKPSVWPSNDSVPVAGDPVVP